MLKPRKITEPSFCIQQSFSTILCHQSFGLLKLLSKVRFLETHSKATLWWWGWFRSQFYASLLKGTARDPTAGERTLLDSFEELPTSQAINITKNHSGDQQGPAASKTVKCQKRGRVSLSGSTPYPVLSWDQEWAAQFWGYFEVSPEDTKDTTPSPPPLCHTSDEALPCWTSVRYVSTTVMKFKCLWPVWQTPQNLLHRPFVVVPLPSSVRLFVTPWTAACLSSLSVPISRSLLTFLCIESVMLPNHLILCHPLLLLLLSAQSLQSCLTLYDPMDCSPPGSSVHRILQARILEWFAILFSGDLPNPGIEPGSPALQADSLPSELKGKSDYDEVIFGDHRNYGREACTWCTIPSFPDEN